MKEYKNIKIRKELGLAIEKLITEYPSLGYNSLASFCSEGIRNQYFQTLDRLGIKQKKLSEFISGFDDNFQ